MSISHFKCLICSVPELVRTLSCPLELWPGPKARPLLCNERLAICIQMCHKGNHPPEEE